MRTLFLYLHVISGCISLLSGIVAMATRKGAPTHVWAGRTYFIGMSGVFIGAVPLSLMGETINFFLLTLAIFSYYMAWTGWRYTKVKNNQVGMAERIITYVTTLCAVGMLGLAGYGFSQNATVAAIILMVFGLICLSLCMEDIKRYGKEPGRKTDWFFGHLSRMIGSYIAAATAFTVTGLPRALPLENVPQLALWLAPTIILTPYIFYLTRYYRKKFRIS